MALFLPPMHITLSDLCPAYTIWHVSIQIHAVEGHIPTSAKILTSMIKWLSSLTGTALFSLVKHHITAN